MTRRLSLNNYHWALLANLAQAFFSWVLLFIIIRLGTKQDVGVFSYLQAILLPLQLFFTLKLRTIQCSDVDFLRSDLEYHRTRQVSTFCFVIVSITVLLFSALSESLLYSGLALVFSYAVYILRESYISILQRESRNNGFFFLNASSGFLSVPIFLLLYLITQSLLFSLIGLAAGRFASYIFVEKKIFSLWAPVASDALDGNAVRIDSLKRVLASAWPLGVAALLGSLFTSIPKIVIERELGIEALADYSAVISLLVAYNLLINSFVQSALPNLAREYLVDRIKFNKKIKFAFSRIFFITAIIGLFAYVFGEEFLALLFGEDYRRLNKEFIFVVLSGASLSVFSIANLMLSSQRTYFMQLPVYLVTCGIVFSLSYFLVESLGVAGPIIAQGLAYGIGAIMAVFVFLRSCKKEVA